MEKLTYEDAFKELNEIISKLESGLITLDETIKLIERGKELISVCHISLSQAKGKLTEVKEILGKLEEV